MSIKKFDLNLFETFDAVMKTRSVTEAANELSLSPSAVSHALKRLRKIFADELFTSKGGAMQPTALALSLNANIARGLSSFASALGSRDFVPGETARTFRIAAGDYFATIFLPRLVARVTDKAPDIHFRIFPCNRLDVVGELDDGHIDFALGWFGDLPERMVRKTILYDQEALVVRRGHPLLDGQLTIERLFSYGRIVVELSGSEDLAKDGYHHEQGVSRRLWIERLLVGPTETGVDAVGTVAVTVPYFAAAAPILQATDLVSALPRRLALMGAKQFGLALLEPPYVPASVGLQALYLQKQESDFGFKWLMSELDAAIKDVDG
jgi:DNA-binding transcriptional LysR family regulator